jgi:hypothetical protein
MAYAVLGPRASRIDSRGIAEAVAKMHRQATGDVRFGGSPQNLRTRMHVTASAIAADLRGTNSASKPALDGRNE